MDAIIATIVEFGAWLWGLVKNVFVALWDVCVDFICYILDKVLTFGIGLVGSLDVSAFQNVGGFSSLPAEILNMLGLIGLGHCFAIIAAAITIRLGLQLIPFVRLGS